MCVEREPEPVPVAEPDPADARRQALETDARARHVEPVVQMPVVRHQLLDLGVGPENVLGIARQRGPAERADPATEQRADIGGHEAGEVERVGDAFLLRHLADVVAIVHGGNAGAMEIEHRAHMHRHRGARRLVDRLGVALAPLLPLREGPAARQIAVDRIMRRGLVGHGVGAHAAAQQFGKDVGGVAEQPDGNRLALGLAPCR